MKKHGREGREGERTDMTDETSNDEGGRIMANQTRREAMLKGFLKRAVENFIAANDAFFTAPDDELIQKFLEYAFDEEGEMRWRQSRVRGNRKEVGWERG
jgi:hypothetical protein